MKGTGVVCPFWGFRLTITLRQGGWRWLKKLVFAMFRLEPVSCYHLSNWSQATTCGLSATFRITAMTCGHAGDLLCKGLVTWQHLKTFSAFASYLIIVIIFRPQINAASFTGDTHTHSESTGKPTHYHIKEGVGSRHAHTNTHTHPGTV